MEAPILAIALARLSFRCYLDRPSKIIKPKNKILAQANCILPCTLVYNPTSKVEPHAQLRSGLKDVSNQAL